MTGNGKTVFRGGYGIVLRARSGQRRVQRRFESALRVHPVATNVYFSNPNTSVLTGATTLNHFPSSLTNIKYDYTPPGTEN